MNKQSQQAGGKESMNANKQKKTGLFFEKVSTLHF